MPEEAQKLEQKPEPMPIQLESDWFLQLLVNMANDGVSIGITLNVSGFLVSGILASGSSYFAAFGAELTSTMTDAEAAKGIKSDFAKFGDIYKHEDREESEDTQPLQPSFIHLENARFFNTSGKPIPANRGVWWRGRLSEVSGFSVGTLSQD
jgi:hypothetical protein